MGRGLKVQDLRPGSPASVTVRLVGREKGRYEIDQDGNRKLAYVVKAADETGHVFLVARGAEGKALVRLVGGVISVTGGQVLAGENGLVLRLDEPGCWFGVDVPGFPSIDECKRSELLHEISAIDSLQVNKCYHVQVVGIYYTGNDQYVSGLPSGTELELKAEPENRYDPFAVSVWHKGKKLGYIPRAENKPYFKALIEGIMPVRCVLGCFIPKGESARRYYTPPRANVTISTYFEAVEWRPLVMMPEDAMGL
ncbi:MAG: HIRAN domain-containing protein [Candidatus Sigynarchaeota archaeon]